MNTGAFFLFQYESVMITNFLDRAIEIADFATRRLIFYHVKNVIHAR